MTKTRRVFTPEDRLSLIQEAEREDFLRLAANTIYYPPYFPDGERSTWRKVLKD